jgi:hypothetical protein
VEALFRTVSEMELFHFTVPKLLIRRRYYVLFLILVFIAQVTKLVQFTYNNTFSKIAPSASMHFAFRVRTAYTISAYSAFVRMCDIFHNSTPTKEKLV